MRVKKNRKNIKNKLVNKIESIKSFWGAIIQRTNNKWIVSPFAKKIHLHPHCLYQWVKNTHHVAESHVPKHIGRP